MMQRSPLRFAENGRFRILMISDFHGKPDFNPKLTAGIEALVDYAQPDFVFLGGDQLCNINKEVLRDFLERALEPVHKRGIPWAHTFGNHDAEQEMTKAEMEEVYESFPLCLSESGPEEISGVPNYCLTVYSHDGKEPLYHLWSLDSHTNYHDYLREFDNIDPDYTLKDFALPRSFGGGHDQASPMFNQVLWYYQESLRREKALGKKLPALLFLHVPLLEFNLLWRNPEQTGFIGHKRESLGSSELNPGLFMACLERGDVKGVFCGHEHLCDFQGEYLGITMAYDSAVGYDMSAHDDLRGGRIIDLYTDGTFSTRHVKLMDLLGKAAMRDPTYFEGGDKYFIRDLDS